MVGDWKDFAITILLFLVMLSFGIGYKIGRDEGMEDGFALRGLIEERKRIDRREEKERAMYESPITVSTLVDKIVRTTNEIVDEEIYKAVIRTGVTINKVDLEKALKQDYDRYEEAYKRGFEDGKREATEEMTEKIKTIFMEGREAYEPNTKRD